mgnify:CR=1 FL=1
MGNQPVTTDPTLIMVINMTVVFAVLWGLSWVIRFIKYIDPTVSKRTDQTELVAATPAPSPATTKLPVASASQDDTDLIVVLAAAVAAYGCCESQIVSIRRIDGKAWAQSSRFQSVYARKEMY